MSGHDAQRFKKLVQTYHESLVNLNVLDYSLNDANCKLIIQRTRDVNPAAAAQLRNVYNHIRYITFKELKDELQHMVNLLNDDKALRGVKRVLIIQDWNGSDAWVACLAVAFGLQFEYVSSPNCEGQDISKFKDKEDAECLLFDDCIFSGNEMVERIRVLRHEHRVNAFACVPLVYSPASLEVIHPCLRTFVGEKMTELAPPFHVAIPIEQRYLLKESEAPTSTLTYLQTNMPEDTASVVHWVFSGENPFRDSTSFQHYRRLFGDAAVPIIRNCEHLTGSRTNLKAACPPKAYAKVMTIISDLASCPLTKYPILTDMATARRRREMTAKQPSRWEDTLTDLQFEYVEADMDAWSNECADQEDCWHSGSDLDSREAVSATIDGILFQFIPDSSNPYRMRYKMFKSGRFIGIVPSMSGALAHDKDVGHYAPRGVRPPHIVANVVPPLHQELKRQVDELLNLPGVVRRPDATHFTDGTYLNVVLYPRMRKVLVVNRNQDEIVTFVAVVSEDETLSLAWEATGKEQNVDDDDEPDGSLRRVNYGRSIYGLLMGFPYMRSTLEVMAKRKAATDTGMPVRIGKGTFGAFVVPAVSCSEPTRLLFGYGSKIFRTEKHWREELRTHEMFEKIDPTSQFTLKRIESCVLPASTSLKYFEENVTTPQIVYEQGPEELRYLKRVEVTLHMFLEHVRPLFVGLVAFADAGIAHNDIKSDNVLYDPITGRMVFIDFGLATEFSERDPSRNIFRMKTSNNVAYRPCDFDIYRELANRSKPDLSDPIYSNKALPLYWTREEYLSGLQEFLVVNETVMQTFHGPIRLFDLTDIYSLGMMLMPIVKPLSAGTSDWYISVKAMLKDMTHPNPLKRLSPIVALAHLDRLLGQLNGHSRLSPLQDFLTTPGVQNVPRINTLTTPDNLRLADRGHLGVLVTKSGDHVRLTLLLQRTEILIRHVHDGTEVVERDGELFPSVLDALQTKWKTLPRAVPTITRRAFNTLQSMPILQFVNWPFSEHEKSVRTTPVETDHSRVQVQVLPNGIDVAFRDPRDYNYKRHHLRLLSHDYVDDLDSLMFAESLESLLDMILAVRTEGVHHAHSHVDGGFGPPLIKEGAVMSIPPTPRDEWRLEPEKKRNLGALTLNAFASPLPSSSHPGYQAQAYIQREEAKAKTARGGAGGPDTMDFLTTQFSTTKITDAPKWQLKKQSATKTQRPDEDSGSEDDRGGKKWRRDPSVAGGKKIVRRERRVTNTKSKKSKSRSRKAGKKQ